jgi:lipopolysaccharide/colanic/teichoic acid biosynthesis glycosyltransferase
LIARARAKGGKVSEEPSRLAVESSTSADLQVVQEPGGSFYHSAGKRLFDVTLVVAAAPVWLLVYIVVALLILLFDGRPIYHRAARVGWRGRDIEVLKFRTMRPDAGQALTSLLASDPELEREFMLTYKLHDDPRVTALGRWLRRLSLDELPQLVNVLKGDMSLVGPRPVVRPELEEYYGELGARVLSVRPGLTGLWQVSGRSLLSYEDRVALDLEYVAKRNLVMDLRVLLCTIPSVCRGHGAF